MDGFCRTRQISKLSEVYSSGNKFSNIDPSFAIWDRLYSEIQGRSSLFMHLHSLFSMLCPSSCKPHMLQRYYKYDFFSNNLCGTSSPNLVGPSLSVPYILHPNNWICEDYYLEYVTSDSEKSFKESQTLHLECPCTAVPFTLGDECMWIIRLDDGTFHNFDGLCLYNLFSLHPLLLDC